MYTRWITSAEVRWRWFILIAVALALGCFIWKLSQLSQPRPPQGISISVLATSHTQVAGVLAGFVVTLLALFLTSHRRTEETHVGEERVIVLLLLSFFGFLATSVLFSFTAGVSCINDIADPLRFELPSLTYFYATVLMLLSLRPVLVIAHHRSTSNLALNLALVTAIAGFVFVASPLVRYGVDELLPVLAAIVGVGLALAYEQLFSRRNVVVDLRAAMWTGCIAMFASGILYGLDSDSSHLVPTLISSLFGGRRILLRLSISLVSLFAMSLCLWFQLFLYPPEPENPTR